MSVPITRRPQLPVTLGLKELLDDPALCKRLDAAGDDIDAVLAQIQLDHVRPENVDTCAHTLLALQIVRDAFFLFTTKGRAVMKAEQARKPSTTN